LCNGSHANGGSQRWPCVCRCVQSDARRKAAADPSTPVAARPPLRMTGPFRRERLRQDTKAPASMIPSVCCRRSSRRGPKKPCSFSILRSCFITALCFPSGAKAPLPLGRFSARGPEGTPSCPDTKQVMKQPLASWRRFAASRVSELAHCFF